MLTKVRAVGSYLLSSFSFWSDKLIPELERFAQSEFQYKKLNVTAVTK